MQNVALTTCFLPLIVSIAAGIATFTSCRCFSLGHGPRRIYRILQKISLERATSSANISLLFPSSKLLQSLLCFRLVYFLSLLSSKSRLVSSEIQVCDRSCLPYSSMLHALSSDNASVQLATPPDTFRKEASFCKARCSTGTRQHRSCDWRWYFMFCGVKRMVYKMSWAQYCPAVYKTLLASTQSPCV